MPLGKQGKPPNKKSKEQKEPVELDVEDVLESAYDTLHRLGLKLPKRPSFDPPKFPEDLSKVTDKKLGFLLGAFTAWATYAEGQLADLDSRHEVVKENEKIIKLLEQLRGEGSIKDREAKAYVSKKTRSRSVTYYKKKAEHKLLLAVFQGYVAKHKAISREISRREKLYEGRES